jgi:hypothetical protein
MSPELANGHKYGQKADVWALGCVLYEMVQFRPAFIAQSMDGLMSRIRRGRFEQDYDESIPQELRDIIASLLSVDERRRPSIRELITLPLLAPYVSQEGGGEDVDAVAAADGGLAPLRTHGSYGLEPLREEPDGDSPVSTAKKHAKRPGLGKGRLLLRRSSQDDAASDSSSRPKSDKRRFGGLLPRRRRSKLEMNEAGALEGGNPSANGPADAPPAPRRSSPEKEHRARPRLSNESLAGEGDAVEGPPRRRRSSSHDRGDNRKDSGHHRGRGDERRQRPRRPSRDGVPEAHFSPPAGTPANAIPSSQEPSPPSQHAVVKEERRQRRRSDENHHRSDENRRRSDENRRRPQHGTSPGRAEAAKSGHSRRSSRSPTAAQRGRRRSPGRRKSREDGTPGSRLPNPSPAPDDLHMATIDLSPTEGRQQRRRHSDVPRLARRQSHETLTVEDQARDGHGRGNDVPRLHRRNSHHSGGQELAPASTNLEQHNNRACPHSPQASAEAQAAAGLQAPPAVLGRQRARSPLTKGVSAAVSLANAAEKTPIATPAHGSLTEDAVPHDDALARRERRRRRRQSRDALALRAAGTDEADVPQQHLKPLRHEHRRASLQVEPISSTEARLRSPAGGGQLAPLAPMDLARQRAAFCLDEGGMRKPPRSLAPLSLDRDGPPRSSLQEPRPAARASLLPVGADEHLPGGLPRRHSDPNMVRGAGGIGVAAQRPRRRLGGAAGGPSPPRGSKDLSLLQLVDRYRSNAEESVPRS